MCVLFRRRMQRGKCIKSVFLVSPMLHVFYMRRKNGEKASVKKQKRRLGNLPWHNNKCRKLLLLHSLSGRKKEAHPRRESCIGLGHKVHEGGGSRCSTDNIIIITVCKDCAWHNRMGRKIPENSPWDYTRTFFGSQYSNLWV